MDTALGNFPDFSDERSHALLKYWEKKRGNAIAPPRAAIDPADIRDLLPNVFMLDRVKNGALTWRLIGTGLVTHFGRDLTGQDFDPAKQPHYDPRYLDIFGMVARQPCGAVINCQTHTTGGQIAPMEQLCLPILDADGDATIIFVHAAFVDMNRRDLQDLGQITKLTIDQFYHFNTGAGVYPMSPGRITP